MDEKPQNPLQKGAELDYQGLRWVWDFRWLRPQELGRLLWPKVGHATKNAERLCRKWESNGLIIRRKLPNHNGTAIVLSDRGAELLREHGIDAKTGKDIGKVAGTEWTPPITWKHSILAAGVLSISHERGHTIYPESKIRRENLDVNIKKIPDGIIEFKGKNNRTLNLWLEVELSKKSGRENIDKLAKNIIRVTEGGADKLCGIKCEIAAIAINRNQICDRGYKLDHKERIANAIKKFAVRDIRILIIDLELNSNGVGVSDFKMYFESIEADKISRAVAEHEDNWDKRRDDEKTEGREFELYNDYMYVVREAELWRENGDWYFEYRGEQSRGEKIRKKFSSMKAAKRYAAALSIESSTLPEE